MSAQGKKVIWWGIVIIVITVLAVLSATPAAAQKKSKNAAPAPTTPASTTPKRADINKQYLVWPNPPAIARLHWIDEFTGEKVDDAAVKKATKPKQGWMDRLAGAQPVAERQTKLPFQLMRPYGVAFDSKGQIYVADQAAGCIFIFNPESRFDVQMIRNKMEANFGFITGIAIDDNDRLFVADDKTGFVIVIGKDHKQEATVGAGQIVRPGGIAIDKENRFLYVVDTGNDVVMVYDADSLKYLRKIGVPSKKHTLTDPGTFSLPTGVAVDKEGNVYVTDTLNNRVEIFDAEGNFVSMFGKAGDGPGHFARPKGIAIDSDDHIWVLDAVQNRMKVFNKDGQLLIYVGESGGWPGQFQEPWGIAIDQKTNRIVTTEQWGGRVQMFRYVTDAEAEQLRKEKEGLTAPASAKSEPPKTTSTEQAATNAAKPAPAAPAPDKTNK